MILKFFIQLMIYLKQMYYGNKCDKEVAINVVAPLSADEVIIEEIVSNADGTTTTKIVTRKKTEAQSGDFRIVTSGDTSKSIMVI